MQSSKRYHIIIEYDGSRYFGWQKQPDRITVQGELETVLTRIANHKVVTYAAGRTDRGVHALGMSIHFDSHAERSLAVWQTAINALLPTDIRCLNIKIADPDFHARHSAVSRTYHYRIQTNKIAQPVFSRQNSWWFPHSLDLNLLQAATTVFHGQHDFSGYRGRDCQAASPITEILAINTEFNDHEIIISITGRSFLHHMVRNIVGAILLVAQNKRDLSWLQQTLIAKTRVPEIPMAPAHGLSFITAKYQ